jgi:hypothetical protein
MGMEAIMEKLCWCGKTENECKCPEGFAPATKKQKSMEGDVPGEAEEDSQASNWHGGN